MVNTPVSYGELVDKITILMIKKIKISDELKLKKVQTELDFLTDIEKTITIDIESIKQELFETNSKLWDVEDILRDFERDNSFGESFVDNARSVYKLNDHRFRLKDKINQLTGSNIQEVKSYKEY